MMAWLRLNQLLIAASIVIAISLLNSVAGILVEYDSAEKDQKVIETDIARVPSSSQEDFSDLAVSFERYIPVEKNDVVNEKSPEELAAEQAAKLAAAKAKIDKTLKPNFAAFDEDHQIGLVGIFKQETTFAVLQIVNYETKHIEYKKVQEMDTLNGFQLVSVDENSVKLNNGQRELNLVLFKRLNG
jgi:hypothetical protein